jgi:hypothetical protein
MPSLYALTDQPKHSPMFQSATPLPVLHVFFAFWPQDAINKKDVTFTAAVQSSLISPLMDTRRQLNQYGWAQELVDAFPRVYKLVQDLDQADRSVLVHAAHAIRVSEPGTPGGISKFSRKGYHTSGQFAHISGSLFVADALDAADLSKEDLQMVNMSNLSDDAARQADKEKKKKERMTAAAQRSKSWRDILLPKEPGTNGPHQYAHQSVGVDS